jgi:hypothetical protein
MGHTTILVRLLGEAVDCWRPVNAVQDGDHYQIVGPERDPVEEWEFEVGEVVQCKSRDGQLIATQLVRSTPGAGNRSCPPSFRGGRTDTRRRALAEAVARAIDEADPIGLLATGAPADEYAQEVDTILPRLPSANGIDDVVVILHEEFSRWFCVDTAGPRQAYESPALRIWQAVRQYRYAG